jgi:hypothetical protein
MRKRRTSVPNDGLETKDSLCNSPNSIIDISERRSPVSRNPSSVEVRDELHRPSEFTENILVRHGSHILMRPGVYGDMSTGIGTSLHHRWVSEDVSTNHEVGSGG